MCTRQMKRQLTLTQTQHNLALASSKLKKSLCKRKFCWSVHLVYVITDNCFLSWKWNEELVFVEMLSWVYIHWFDEHFGNSVQLSNVGTKFSQIQN